MSNAPYPGHPDYNVPMTGTGGPSRIPVPSPAPVNTPQYSEQEEQHFTQAAAHPQGLPQNPDQLEALINTIAAALHRNQPPTASVVKSEKIADTPAFDGTGPRVHEDLEQFKASLESRFDVNSDRYPTPKSRIHYAYARTSGRAAAIVLDGFKEGAFQDWTDLTDELERSWGDADPEYTAARRLFGLKQTHRTFTDFYPEFKLAARRTPYRGSGLKLLLRNALSRELTERLSTVDVRPLSYETFVHECFRQDNILRAAAARQPTKTWKPSAPAPAPAPVTFRPAPAPAHHDPMDIDRSRRAAPTDREAERERRRALRLCYYCASADHRADSCPEAPKAGPRSNIRAASPSSVLSGPPAYPVAPPSPVSVALAPRSPALGSLKDQSLG